MAAIKPTGECSGLWDAFRARSVKEVASIIQARRAAGLPINRAEALRAAAWYGMKEIILEFLEERNKENPLEIPTELPELAKAGGFSELALWLQGRLEFEKKAGTVRREKQQQLQEPKDFRQGTFFEEGLKA